MPRPSKATAQSLSKKSRRTPSDSATAETIRPFRPRDIVWRYDPDDVERAMAEAADSIRLYEDDTVIVKPAGSKGLGVFANRDIRPGEAIVAVHGQVVPGTQESIYCIGLNDENYVLEPDIPGCFLNHSCDPNAVLQSLDDRSCVFVSFVFIKKGTEITWDYGYDAKFGIELKCKCGSYNCRGYVVAVSEYEKLKAMLKRRKRAATKKTVMIIPGRAVGKSEAARLERPKVKRKGMRNAEGDGVNRPD